jgi:hypothetical protein
MVDPPADPPAKRPCRSAAAGASALERLLGMPPAVFFSQHWEVAPLVCRGSGSRGALDAMPTWEDLLGVLGTAASTGSLIVLKDQHPTQEHDSAAAAYLDGSSLIVNHAERCSAGVHALCAALRHDVPHAFANMYLTPPHARAVDAHADDRDVLVLQLEGSKRWRVWPVPPVVRPTAHEQVGKAELPVPAAVWAATPQELTLARGDVRPPARTCSPMPPPPPPPPPPHPRRLGHLRPCAACLAATCLRTTGAVHAAWYRPRGRDRRLCSLAPPHPRLAHRRLELGLAG